jgi:conjugative transfer region protein TrbK
MSTYVTSQRFLRATAVVFVILAVAAALVESHRGENGAVLTRLEPGEADALMHELWRCRLVTFDDPPVLETCRRLWAENRRHFFISTKSPNVSDLPESTELTKSQQRIPQKEIDLCEGR